MSDIPITAKKLVIQLGSKLFTHRSTSTDLIQAEKESELRRRKSEGGTQLNAVGD